MDETNDIFRVSDLRWNHSDDLHKRVLGKVDYIEHTPEGFRIHLKKEKKMDNDEIRADILKNAHSISIETEDDGKTVKATVYGRNILNQPYVVAESKAKCGPNDIFDFNIGAKLAMDRLYEGYNMTPKPKRKPYNGLIYIYYYPGYALEDKSLYRVVEGKIKGCYYHNRPENDPYIFCDMTDDQLCKVLKENIFGSKDPYVKVIAHFVRNDQTKA